MPHDEKEFNEVPPDPALRVKALESLLVEKGLVDPEALDVLIRVLAPVTPHICHALWELLSMDGELLDATWPVVDPLALKRKQVQLVVQINGKLRAEIEVEADAEGKEIESIALADHRISRHIGNAAVRKFVIVPGRLVNIVV